MGEVVNRTWEAAARWQREVAWIRINVGFIKAELPYIGRNVADIEQLVRDFEPVFAQFCDEEMAVFVAARQVEAEMTSREDFAAKLQALAKCFQPWLEDYHGAVMDRRDADDRGLGLALLQGCGSELHKARRRFAEAVASLSA